VGAIALHRRIATLVVLTAMAAVLPQCSRAPSAEQATSAPSSATARVTPTSTTPTATPATVRTVTAGELGPSWRPGCPVGPELLRRVELDYVGFDGQIHRGALVVHQDVVADVIAIFDELQRMRYPIAKMQTVEHYPNAEDELSMEDNNTSAFNCRPLPGSSQPSWHAFGRAVDVNPLINPFIDSDGHIEPTTGGPYLDRGRTDPGMLHAGDPAVRAFTDRGWRWGGDWRTPKDYQHFELHESPRG
jgi:hypothetical protein